jgi:hypothetical protein
MGMLLTQTATMPGHISTETGMDELALSEKKVIIYLL